MSLKSRLLILIQNDNTIYQLLLLGLFIASPSLHYLCYHNSFDPLWLRIINSALCLIAFCFSFYSFRILKLFELALGPNSPGRLLNLLRYEFVLGEFLYPFRYEKLSSHL